MAQLKKVKISTVNLDRNFEVEAQFNPSELSMSHGVSVSDERPIGGSQKAQDARRQTTGTKETTLRASLYFDAYLMAAGAAGASSSGADGGAWDVSSDELLTAEFKQAKEDIDRKVHDLIRMARLHKDSHSSPTVLFIWGEGLSFNGWIRSISTNYMMFDPAGKPTRVKVDLEISGEEAPLKQEAAQAPPQSPDRTKERLMLETDQMWMLAAGEYGDPAMWKTIAEANGILNPRAIDRAVRLRLPSVR